MGGVTISPAPTYLQEAAINTATAAQYGAIAAISGMKIRVYRLALITTSAQTIIFQDGGNALSGPIALGANGSMVLDNSGDPWFTTSLGNAFNISISASVQLSGMIYYMQTPEPALGG